MLTVAESFITIYDYDGFDCEFLQRNCVQKHSQSNENQIRFRLTK